MRSLTKLQSLFATALSMTACGASTVDHSGLGEDVCSGATTYDPLAGVTPATPVDYLELRQTFAGSSSTTVASRAGVPCATATNSVTCNANLAAVTSTNGWKPNLGGGFAPLMTEYVVYTRGDEVGTVTSYAALATFLAPVDDVHDAALLVSQNPDRQHRIVCGANTGGSVSGGFELVTDTGDSCGPGTHVDEELVFVSTAGDLTIRQDVVIANGNPNCVSGRRPAGMQAAPSRVGKDVVGAFFAECAYLEAASVVAFERLARELHAHGAPATLITQAERSRDDEVRHTKITAALARRSGVEPAAANVDDHPVRNLVEIALENAVEGCVRETYGALVALHQRDHATDARVAAAMRTIATDETRHAALAWDVAEWLESRLTLEERKSVRDARAQACVTLREQLAAPVHGALTDAAGIPAPKAALALFDAVAPALWA